MSYEDPRTGRDRNLGQEDVSSSWSWVAGFVVVLALAIGGLYFFGHNQKTADNNSATPSTAATNVPPSQQSSGPGVQGAPGSTAGPAAKAPDGASTGASTGTGGNNDVPAATTPSQDSTGVKGGEGGTAGPAPKSTP
jgi:hypothetical protein